MYAIRSYYDIAVVGSANVDLTTFTDVFPRPGETIFGQKLLLNGKMLTGRDAAHKRIADMLAAGEKLPVDFTNRIISYNFV